MLVHCFRPGDSHLYARCSSRLKGAGESFRGIPGDCFQAMPEPSQRGMPGEAFLIGAGESLRDVTSETLVTEVDDFVGLRVGFVRPGKALLGRAGELLFVSPIL